jgi:hypothetical protein
MELEKYNAMKSAIAECHKIDEVKLIRDKAEAVRYALIQAKESPEWIRQAEEIKLRAERKAGEILKETVREPGNPLWYKPDTIDKPKLNDLNINKVQSSNWQNIADIPEEQFEDYMQGKSEITTSGAVKIAKKLKTAKQRQELAEKGKEIELDKKWNIECADIKTYQTNKQYDFIITDPPYPKEYLPLYETLAIQSKEWLKDNGLLIVMCGQSYLNEIIKLLDKHLKYYWTACYYTPGQPTPLRQRQVNTTWKPLLIYSKNNNYKGKIFGDVFKSEANDKDFHKWGQSVSGMYSIISQICLPGQSIFDPFLGAGTTGIAAIKHGCLFDGIDILEENINISKARLNDEAKER